MFTFGDTPFLLDLHDLHLLLHLPEMLESWRKGGLPGFKTKLFEFKDELNPHNRKVLEDYMALHQRHEKSLGDWLCGTAIMNRETTREHEARVREMHELSPRDRKWLKQIGIEPPAFFRRARHSSRDAAPETIK